jgi:putative superfamily III holin-X
MSAPPAPDPSRAEAAAFLRDSLSSRSSPPFEPKLQHGLFHHLGRWCAALGTCFQLRSQLALLEAKEAGSRYAVIAGLLAVAVVVALIGYLLLVLTAIFVLAAWLEGPHIWLKILGGATALHVLLALILVLLAKARLKAGIFEKTKAEFRKDHLWHTNPISHDAPKN